MKFFVFFLLTIFSSISFAFFDHPKKDESTIIHNPKFTLGMSYIVPSQFQRDRARYGQINGIIFLFNDETSHETISVSIIGLGIGFSSHHGFGMVVSPVSFAYKNIGISYNFNLQKSGQGFSLLYQF